MRKNKVRYSEIIPRTRQWPIVQLAKNRKKFIQEVTEETFNKIHAIPGLKSLREELELTIYREKIRMKANPWKVDPKDEKPFWNYVQKRLAEAHGTKEQEHEENDLLKEIIARYTNEISGNFKNSYYRFARTIITFGFSRLLNAARVPGFTAMFSKQLDLDDKIKIIGEPEHIRSLAKIGTVIMVPTHFSNLDSILIGWIIQFLGLPAFIYGAGLNLFNIKLFAYFMNSLGAYKVDRRKKNIVYLETLKSYSNMALRKGCHSLFFPGGTRSRSGEIEKSLKLGLLGTAIESQRTLYEEDIEKAKKIFVVPVVLNYQFTLEAPSLINEHLRRTGQERYYKESDRFSNSYKIATFLIKFFTKGSNISISIGKGMDILGNYVDKDGHSFDKNGTPIHTRDYFISDGKITHDAQREQTYVRILGQRIVEEFHKYNEVYPSHLVAYTAFKMLERKNPKLDLYTVLRLNEDDLELDYQEFKNAFKKLRTRIFKLKNKGSLLTQKALDLRSSEAILDGLKNLGMYHAIRPLALKNDKIIIQDPNTLYYYHNRLNGYGLEKYI